MDCWQLQYLPSPSHSNSAACRTVTVLRRNSPGHDVRLTERPLRGAGERVPAGGGDATGRRGADEQLLR